MLKIPAVILIVEDEPILRMAAADMVEEAGYCAIEAASADDALAILERRDYVKVVFTDIDMPGSMDGLELVQAVHDRWPPIRFLVTSGQVAVGQADMPADGVFLSKPYAPGRIARELERLAVV